MPEVVLSDPIKRKNGMHTVAIVTPNHLNCRSVGIFVMPNTEVTKVRGRKKIETCICQIRLLNPWLEATYQGQ